MPSASAGRVLLVDCDLHANASSILPVDQRTASTLTHVLKQQATFAFAPGCLYAHRLPPQIKSTCSHRGTRNQRHSDSGIFSVSGSSKEERIAHAAAIRKPAST